MKMKTVYLVLAVIGAVVPYWFLFDHFAAAGYAPSALVGAAFANAAARGFTSDLLLSSMVFWVFMVQQQRRRHGPGPSLYIILNLLVGLSCALPAYLYAREKPAREAGS